MKELVVEASEMITKELARANEKHELFHSLHEGESVLREEVDESIDCLQEIVETMGDLWSAVRADDNNGALEAVSKVYTTSLFLIGEVAQVGAMAKKITDSILITEPLKDIASELEEKESEGK